ncbi:Uncharacterised protein [Streptococcus pneumoniae]|nr:Uncharacterised protein [Streptococcus pneumoniae]
MCFTHSFFHFAILRKSLQTNRILVTDFVSPCQTDRILLRQFYLQPQNMF